MSRNYKDDAANREPILLWGFDFDTQRTQDFASIQWGVVWLRRTYTDENDEFIKSLNARKQQEVRHGNNITVLFQALFYCRAYYGHPRFWRAIAKGFSGKVDQVREMVTLLTESRKIKREMGGGKHTSDTIRAVDGWIDFLDDNHRPQPRQVADHTVDANATTFFASKKGKLANAAAIPRVSPPAWKIPKAANRGWNRDSHTSSHFSLDLADRITFPRKRSASPLVPEPSPFKRRQLRPGDEAYHNLPTDPRSMKDRSNELRLDTPNQGWNQGSPPRTRPLPENSPMSQGRGGSRQDSPICSSSAVRGIKTENESSPTMLQEVNSLLKDRNTALEKKLAVAVNQVKDDFALRSVEKDILTLKDKVETLAKTMEELTKGNDPMITKLQGDIKSIQNTLKDSSPTNSKNMLNIEGLIKAADGKMEDTSSFQSDMENMRKIVADYTAETSSGLSTLQSNMDSLKSSTLQRNEAVSRDVTALQTKLESLCNQIAANWTENNAKIQNLETSVATLQDENKSLNDKINTLTDSVVSLYGVMSTR